MGAVFGTLGSVVGWLTGTGSCDPKLPQNLGPEADIPDPLSTLTKREVAYIRQAWALVKPNIRIHGEQFFLLLFKRHPAMINKFSAFKGKKVEELAGNKRLIAHGTTVMSAIDSYIENLDAVTTVIEMLKTTGKNHQERGISIKEFENLAPVLVDYLSAGLGPLFTKEAKSAWIHLLKVIVTVVGSAYT